MDEQRTGHEARYSISVVASLVDLHPQTLRKYEDLGLVVPQRTPGNHRLYSDHDVDRLRLIVRLRDDLGVNLAGVEVVLHLSEQVTELRELAQGREEALRQEIARLRRLVAVEGPAWLLPGEGSGRDETDDRRDTNH